ncbi:hypothetical protein HA466_0214520 [Hirschfeldia incana]|nr:hypothetical protein HA466_0214520 [Hirschfeldia incana]
MNDEFRRLFSSSILLVGGSQSSIESMMNFVDCFRRQFFSSVSLLIDSRWLVSTNRGGYPRRTTVWIKYVALCDYENRRLLLIAIEKC